MSMKRRKPEEIVSKLRQVDVLASQGKTIAQAIQDWITAMGAKTAYITPGSPWESRYCESFNARLRDELLNGELFYSLQKAKILIENWCKDYDTKGHTHHWVLAASTRKLNATALVCATKTSSAWRLQRGKQTLLRLRYNWTTFCGKASVAT